MEAQRFFKEAEIRDVLNEVFDKKTSRDKDNIKDNWKLLWDYLMKVADQNCGLRKASARTRLTWW